MKLTFFTTDYKEKIWWTNFRKSLHPKAWPDDVLQKHYNARLDVDHGPYVEFKTEEDATFFMLRFM